MAVLEERGDAAILLNLRGSSAFRHLLGMPSDMFEIFKGLFSALTRNGIDPKSHGLVATTMTDRAQQPQRLAARKK
jgi:hypothetical protein